MLILHNHEASTNCLRGQIQGTVDASVLEYFPYIHHWLYREVYVNNSTSSFFIRVWPAQQFCIKNKNTYRFIFGKRDFGNFDFLKIDVPPNRTTHWSKPWHWDPVDFRKAKPGQIDDVNFITTYVTQAPLYRFCAGTHLNTAIWIHVENQIFKITRAHKIMW